ncbi:MAG: hypothetical protein E7652_00215 [Ruminococcaceae bacterium]|nr:hypothetical protein [Oscillospiraceae bacterium]
MVYLDANSFYWYIGRDKLGMGESVPKHHVELLRNYLDQQTNKSIPSSVLIEMIVHFRNQPKMIRTIIDFIQEKNLRILNNIQEYCYTNENFTLLSVMLEDDLKQYADTLLDKKIEIEVKHSCMFLTIISLIYAEYYINNFSNLKSVKNNVLTYLGKEMSNHLNEYQGQLTDSLKNGYVANKPEQYLKKEYIDLLVQNCIVFQMIIDTIVEYFNGEENLYDIMCQSAMDARNNGFNDSKIMGIIVDALAEDSKFAEYAKNKIVSAFMRKGYSIHQAKYLKLMLNAWLDRGQKLLKNDIFDMLCVRVLDKNEIDNSLSVLVDQSSYLISFDEMMMNFLSNNPGNVRLMNNFLISPM